MFRRYYQEELSYLRELGQEFAQAHPALAPMLSGPGSDPDVERLLEGVAFLTALLRQKLDDEFPEIIHTLMNILWPHYLRPIPCCSIVSFSPKPTLKQSQFISAGIYLAATPIEETSCIFKTCYPVEIHPIELLEVSVEQPAGNPPAIRLFLKLNGINLSKWQPNSLRFYLGGDFGQAADLYLLLRKHLECIILKTKNSQFELTPDFLKPVGFNENIIPYPSQAFPGYRILQEYFVLPEKFLFLEITGWERWKREDSEEFEIIFQLKNPPFLPSRVTTQNFVLFATPVINLFPYEADPIRVEHKKSEYLIRPFGNQPEHYQVYSIEKVIGLIQGTAEEREYVPFDTFIFEEKNKPVYQTINKISFTADRLDTYITLIYPPETEIPVSETLSIKIICTNGFLPERLQIGDISLPTSSSPEFATFKNIRPPTAYILPPLKTDLPWRLLSHLSLNYISLASLDALKGLLELYIFPESHDRTMVLANQKRIDGIESIKVIPSNRLINGLPIRGQEITIQLREDHFASAGDVFLFGCILDYFLGNYATINTYTKLTIQELLKGTIYQWKERIGDRPLI